MVVTNQTIRLPPFVRRVPQLVFAFADFAPHLGQHLLVLDDVLVSGEQNIKLSAAKLRDEGSSSSRRPLKTKWGHEDASGKSDWTVLLNVE